MAPGAAPAALRWLEGSTVAAAMRESIWLYPAVETVHLLGVTVLVGAAFMFDLRLLGVSRHLPVIGLASHLLAWSRRGAAVVVPTGLLLLAPHATRLWENPAFQVKLLLVALAGANALAFHLLTLRNVAVWEAAVAPPVAARAAALISLALWTGAIVCGRLLAYV